MNLVSDTKSRKLALMLCLSIVFVGFSSNNSYIFSYNYWWMDTVDSSCYSFSIHYGNRTFFKFTLVICFFIWFHKWKTEAKSCHNREHCMVCFLIILKEYFNNLTWCILSYFSRMEHVHTFYHLNTSYCSWYIVSFPITWLTSNLVAKK